MSKQTAAGSPASFKVTATIAALYALPAPRQLVAQNGTVRNITHRVLLNPSPSLKKVEDECAKHLRQDGETPVAFALHRRDGLYALDMDRNQLSMLSRTGLRLDELEMNAKGATMNFIVDLRLEGDEVVNVRTGDMIEINFNHAVVQAPEIIIAPNVLNALLINRNVAALVAQQYGIGMPTATQQVTNPKAVPIEDDANIPEDEGSVVTGTRGAPAKVPARKRTAANTKIS